ncbi:MucR family transcriptional regulator [Magnetococcus sp. PR-3]|uniref:MucR family transcriptional regulator n=1 Tax=Magnetococcus sp. PR-3 TaxID=3120355 RepID=UPI002FCE68A1
MSDLVQKTAEIVEAFVSNNSITAREIPQFIKEVHTSLNSLTPASDISVAAPAPVAAQPTSQPEPAPVEEAAPANTKPEPAVPVAESVSDEFVTCLVCAKKCKTLKGHLTRSHNMDLDTYRNMFDLPSNHPVVSPDYSAKRRKLAIDAGLGEKLRKSRKKKS